MYDTLFVGRQLCWKDQLDFRCHSVLYGWIVKVSPQHFNKNGKLSMNTLTDFLKTWYVGSGGHKYYNVLMWSVVTKCENVHVLHIYSDWLITKMQISRVLYGLQ